MNKDLIAIFEYLEREKGIKREIVAAAIEESLQAAAQKSVGGASNVTVQVDGKTGTIQVLSEMHIVEEVTNPAQEISLESAKEFDPDCEIDQYIDLVVTPKDFGRIAAQKARQIIQQKLKTAEKDVIHEEYRHRVNELVSGTVNRFAKGHRMLVDLGKVEAVMPMRFFPKTEHYQPGDKILALLHEVKDTEMGGAEVILSRSHPEFVKQLFIQEVPEISDGTVVIERIVREPGYRTKISVSSTDPKVDPVGACVGVRGLRVKNIVRELNNEKIDIIPFDPDPVNLLQNALDPIEIRKININENEELISIVIEDDDYPVVIGKKGLNASLNGRLIGYELEVQRINDYRRARTIERLEIAENNHPALDQTIDKIPGVNKLIAEQIFEKYDTPRKILQTPTEELAELPGISMDIAELIMDQVTELVSAATQLNDPGTPETNGEEAIINDEQPVASSEDEQSDSLK